MNRHSLWLMAVVIVLSIAAVWASFQALPVLSSAWASFAGACQPWVQVNDDAFGLDDPSGQTPPYGAEDGFEVAVFKGQLYVGMEADNLYGARVWRTKAGVTVAQNQGDWEQVVDDAFGDVNNNDHIDSLEGFDGYLYASTAQRGLYDGTEVWRSSSSSGDAGTWVQVNDDGFGIASAPFNENFKDMTVFSADGIPWLCGGTMNWLVGAQVWCTDGSVKGGGPKLNWVQKNQDGFGDARYGKVWSTAIMGDYLYVGTECYSGGACPGDVWRSDGSAEPSEPSRWQWEKVFEATANQRLDIIGPFDGSMYVGFDGGNGTEVWRSSSGKADTWRQVNSDGFGNPNNGRVIVDASAVYNGALYLATLNQTDGAQVWRTADGTTWTQVNSDGFGDADTFAAEFIPFNDYLYAWATNYQTGQKVMRTECPAPTPTPTTVPKPVGGYGEFVSPLELLEPWVDPDFFPPPPVAGEDVRGDVLRSLLSLTKGLSKGASLAGLPSLQASTVYTLPDPAWRIGVLADGLYQLPYQSLVAAGVPVTTTPPSALHLLWRGQEVALQEAGTEDGALDPGDALLFYGERFRGSVQDEKYTDENVYWLMVDESALGRRMASRAVTPDGEAIHASWYTATVHVEENLQYWARWSTAPGTEDTWFWDRLTASSPMTRSYSLTLTAPAPETYTATLTVELAGRSYNTHHLRFSLNGTVVGDTTWAGMVGKVATLPMASTLIQEGANTLAVTVLTEGGAQDICLNWIEIEYRRRLVAQDDALFLTAPLSATAAYTLTGFTAAPLLYDVTDPLAPTRLLSPTVLTETTVGLAFQDAAPTGAAYLAVAEAAVPEITPTLYHPPLDLLHPDAGADYVLIAPRAFLTATQPLLAWRAAQGLRVKAVAVEDIYPLFNGGIFHPEAIRAFLAYAHDHWPSPPPTYVLLVGDGHFNLKGYNPNSYGEPTPVHIPPYLSFADPWQGEVPVDVLYADRDGDAFPDLYLGRIPANSVAEVEAVVAKILAYEQETVPASSILQVADNVPDGSGDFQYVVEQLVSDFVPSTIPVQRVYLTDYCGPPVSPPQPCPSATLALTQTWGAGVAMVTYSGHASVNRWAHEQLLLNEHVATFPPSGELPLTISLDCLDGYWMMPPAYAGLADPRALAEVLMVTPQRGAVAAFAPAGLGLVFDEEAMGREMYRALFQEGVTQLGPLTQRGRERMQTAGSHLAQTYTLFGDPAMRLRLLPWKIYLPIIYR